MLSKQVKSYVFSADFVVKICMWLKKLLKNLLLDLECGMLMYEVIMVNDGTMNLVIGTWADIERENEKNIITS